MLIANSLEPLELGDSYFTGVTLVTLFSSFFMLACSFLGIGKFVKFLSEYFFSGFISAASVLIAFTQLKPLLGMEFESKKGTFSLIYFLIGFFGNLHTINLATSLFGIACFSFLLATKILSKKHKLEYPLPDYLAVVIVSILLCKFTSLPEKGVKLIGGFPSEFPLFQSVSFNVCCIPSIIKSSLILSVVSFLITISIVKTFSAKFNYSCHENQELFALGLANLIGAFTNAYFVSGSLSRSAVLVSTKSKSQFASLLSAFVVILIVLFLSSWIAFLPYTVLAAIVLLAISGVMGQILLVGKLWNRNRIDCSEWIVTFSVVIVFDVEIGLAIALFYSFLIKLYRYLHPNMYEVGKRRGKLCRLNIFAQRIPGKRIFRVLAPPSIDDILVLKAVEVELVLVMENDLIKDKIAPKSFVFYRNLSQIEETE